MSIRSSSRKSTTPATGESKGKSVRFEVNYNLKSLLLDFFTDDGKKVFEDLLCYIKTTGQEIRDDELTQLLKEARGCISILNGNFTLFVQVVLLLKWNHRSEEVVNEYKGFLLSLCSAHNYFSKIIIDHLVDSFKPETAEEWLKGNPPEDYLKCIQHTHSALESILALVPMSRNLLLSSITSKYPYVKKSSHEHEVYVYNLLRIITYQPVVTSEVFRLIVNNLILLDVHAPRSELEEAAMASSSEMETDEMFEIETEKTANETKKTNHPIGHTLDLCLILVYKFLHQRTHTSEGVIILESVKSLYANLLKVFDDVILPTHAIHHVQFIMFYFLSLKPLLGGNFIQHLWKKVTNPNIAPVLRQTAVSYLASFISRSQYVSTPAMLDTLVELNNWVHSYIDCQDTSNTGASLKAHSVFYATCQTIFYVIAFRYKDLVGFKNGLMALQSMNLAKVVSCRLNPLKFCQTPVVSNFASVARAYQIAYCYSVIERNNRRRLPQLCRDASGSVSVMADSQIDTFFPFDPYLLERSSEFILPIYREYSSLDETDYQEASVDQDKDEIDDFLLESPKTTESHLSHFSYGASPGFRHF